MSFTVLRTHLKDLQGPATLGAPQTINIDQEDKLDHTDKKHFMEPLKNSFIFNSILETNKKNHITGKKQMLFERVKQNLQN